MVWNLINVGELGRLKMIKNYLQVMTNEARKLAMLCKYLD